MGRSVFYGKENLSLSHCLCQSRAWISIIVKFQFQTFAGGRSDKLWTEKYDLVNMSLPTHMGEVCK